MGHVGMLCEKVMLEHIFKVHSSAIVYVQTSHDKILRFSTELVVVGGEREVAGFNSLVSVLYFWALKGRAAMQHRVQDDSDGPVVDLIAVALVCVEDLRGDVVGSSANSPLLLSVVEDHGGKSKVPHHDLHFLVEEQVSKFEVPVNYLLFMDENTS